VITICLNLHYDNYQQESDSCIKAPVPPEVWIKHQHLCYWHNRYVQ